MFLNQSSIFHNIFNPSDRSISVISLVVEDLFDFILVYIPPYIPDFLPTNTSFNFWTAQLDGSASIRPSIMRPDVFISPRKNPSMITFLVSPSAHLCLLGFRLTMLLITFQRRDMRHEVAVRSERCISF